MIKMIKVNIPAKYFFKAFFTRKPKRDGEGVTILRYNFYRDNFPSYSMESFIIDKARHGWEAIHLYNQFDPYAYDSAHKKTFIRAIKQIGYWIYLSNRSGNIKEIPDEME